jgi:hypothetical protein
MEDRLQDKDKTVAFILELLGIFGILGIGHIYAGLIKQGVIRLVLWIIILVVGWVAASVLSYFIIGLCMMPFLVIAQIGIPIWSAFQIKKKMDEEFPDS